VFFIHFLLILNLHSVLADDVEIHDGRSSAFKKGSEIIERAKSGDVLWVGTYIFQNDRVGDHRIGELIDAAKRGVDVRLIVDWSGNELPQSKLTYLVENGVKVKFYNPLRFVNPIQLNHRMHSKFIVLNNETLIGDRNIGAEYSNFVRNSKTGREIYIKGKSVGSLQVMANEIWDDPVSIDINSRPIRDVERSKIRSEIAVGRKDFPDTPGSPASRFSTDNISFVYDKPSARGSGRGVSSELFSMIAEADEAITIVSPYLVLTDELESTLKLLKENRPNVKIRFITNSLRSTDVRLTSLAHHGDRHRLAKLGVDVYETLFQLHEKTVIVDQNIVFNGSYNFDSRSQNINVEMGTIIRSAELGKAAEESVNRRLKRSVRTVAEGRVVARVKRCFLEVLGRTVTKFSAIRNQL